MSRDTHEFTRPLSRREAGVLRGALSELRAFKSSPEYLEFAEKCANEENPPRFNT